MGKRGKPYDASVEGTQPITKIVPVVDNGSFKVPDADRVERDVEIIDKGWNNTPEDRR